MIRFNTGALYREEGQIIRAEKLDDERVVFNDISRDIFAVMRGVPLTEYAVMHAYLYNLYEGCMERDEYAMARTMDRRELPVDETLEALPKYQKRYT